MIEPKSFPKVFEYKILFVVFISTYAIPIIFLFILKQRNSIDDFHLKTIKERKLPILFFFTITLLLAYRLFQIKVVNLLAFSFFGVAVAMFIIYLFLIIKMKVSIHTLGIGSLTGFIILLSFHYKIKLLILISFLFLLFGLIAYARLKIKAHNNKEIYLGYLIGISTQFGAYYLLPLM